MDGPKRPRIVWVSLGAGQGGGPVGPADHGERVASLADLWAGPRADGLVLEGGPEAVGPALQQLRRHPDYALSLIYVSGSPNPMAAPLVAALADGPPPRRRARLGIRAGRAAAPSTPLAPQPTGASGPARAAPSKPPGATGSNGWSCSTGASGPIVSTTGCCAGYGYGRSAGSSPWPIPAAPASIATPWWRPWPGWARPG